MNDLKQINCGIPVLDTNIDLLMYADDIVLLAENENSLQKMLDCVAAWTEKWRISLNESKTQVVHFRTKSREKTKVQFKCCNSDIDTVEGYKYLGIWFDEFLDFQESIIWIDLYQILCSSSFDQYHNLPFPCGSIK